tara:strand:- start:37 stop:594 length:558 start_codon:yes stop_codon:yes gene_type:complete
MKLIVTKDIQALATLVNEICDCDVFSKRRVRKHVDGRMIFSKVLAKKGLTLTGIGKILGKNHATICFYLRKIDGYLEYDEILRNKYEYVAGIYAPTGEVPNYYQYTRTDLLSEIKRLRDLLEQEKSANRTTTSLYKQASRDDSRLSPIYKVIKERTSQGVESEVLRKLNHMYNGIDLRVPKQHAS